MDNGRGSLQVKFITLFIVGEAATISNDYVLLVLNKDISCTAVVVHPGLALTHKGCVNEGDSIKVCKRGIENGKDCDEGASLEVEAIFEHPPGVLIKLSDESITPVPINTKELAVGTPCNVIGFGNTQTGINKEIVSDVPQIFSTSIKDIQKDSIELKTHAPAGICKGDEGGAVICDNKLAGILSEKGSCVATAIKAIPIPNIDKLIARQATTTLKEPESLAPYVGASFVTAIFPAVIVTLLFP